MVLILSKFMCKPSENISLIRGIKIGVDAFDIVAVWFEENGLVSYRHVYVQVPVRPVSDISRASEGKAESQTVQNKHTKGLCVLEQLVWHVFNRLEKIF